MTRFHGTGFYHKSGKKSLERSAFRDRWFHDRPQFECAEPFVREAQGRHRTGYADRPWSDDVFIVDNLRPAVEANRVGVLDSDEHVGARGDRAVDEEWVTGGAVMADDPGSATNAAKERLCHCDRERGCHDGINRVAAAREHERSSVGGALIVRDHEAAIGAYLGHETDSPLPYVGAATNTVWLANRVVRWRQRGVSTASGGTPTS